MRVLEPPIFGFSFELLFEHYTSYFSRLYKTVIRPTLIYDSECWALHKAEHQRMHTTEMKMFRWVQSNTRKGRLRKFRSDEMVKPITTYICHPETTFVVWPCDEKRKHKRCKACNNNEGGREETLRKPQTEVDGPSAERSETAQAQNREGWRKAIMAIDPGQG